MPDLTDIKLTAIEFAQTNPLTDVLPQYQPEITFLVYCAYAAFLGFFAYKLVKLIS